MKFQYVIANSIHQARVKGRFVEIENKSTKQTDIVKLADTGQVRILLDLIFNRD